MKDLDTISDNLIKNIQKPLALFVVSAVMIIIGLISYIRNPSPSPVIQQPSDYPADEPLHARETPEIETPLSPQTTAPAETPIEPPQTIEPIPQKELPEHKRKTFIF